MSQAFITVITGVLVFVIGQIIVKFFIEPANEQSKLIGEIFFGLTYYRNVYANPGSARDEILDKTSDAFRKYGSQLKGTTNAVRSYKLWETLGLVPIRANIDKAVGNLICIANSIHLPYGQTESDIEAGRANKNDADKTESLLKERKLFRKALCQNKVYFLILFGLWPLVIINSHAASLKEDYELSERCGKKCEEAFKGAYGNGMSSSEGSSMFSNYVNHYNKKLNKCFILVTTTSISKDKNRDFLVMKNLFDINENKEYGGFAKFTRSIKPNDCRLLDKVCSSEQEWEQLIKPFMEE